MTRCKTLGQGHAGGDTSVDWAPEQAEATRILSCPCARPHDRELELQVQSSRLVDAELAHHNKE
jgi:hypothetical protein